MRDRKEFTSKNRAKTSWSESRKQKENVNRYSFKKKQKGPDPSSCKKNRTSIVKISSLNLPILRIVWHKGVVSILHVLSVVVTTQGYVVMVVVAASSVFKMDIF